MERIESLAELMAAAQSGDKLCYGRLLALIQPLLLRFFRRRVSDNSIVEDLGQTALLRIHLYRHTYDCKQKFESWMYALARNVLNDHFAKSGSTVPLLDEGQVPEAEDVSSAPLGRLMVESALDSLEEGQAEILRLTKVVGLSTQETAQILGISVAAVKVRTHRAIAALKTRLFKSEDP